jgi:hypothetical protein
MLCLFGICGQEPKLRYGSFSLIRRQVIEIMCITPMKLTLLGITLLLATDLFAQGGAHTPAVGSSERQAIMDAMRLDFYPGDLEAAHTNPKGVVFKVLFLKVHGDWACTHVDPVDAAGKEVAESRWGLLRRRRGQWSDVNYFDALRPFASEEAAQSALEMAPSTIAKVRAAFPEAPNDIFP